MNKQTELILNLFSLSISAHNTQPFRLKVVSENRYEILVDNKRSLPIADPHGRDLLIGLGALLETLSIGLSREKLLLENLNISSDKTKLASFALKEDLTLAIAPLEAALTKRFSYRAKFDHIIPIENNKFHSNGVLLKFVNESKNKKHIGDVFDKTNAKFLISPGYIDELYSWMRFKKDHPNWATDGLNSESMGLKGIEALGASIVLKPGVFRALTKMKVIASIISEKTIIESSSAVVAIVGPSQSPIEIGRGFMRGWLELTAQGLYGAPLSLLTDDKEAMEKMREEFKLNTSEHIYNILRVGPLPKNYKSPERARLKKEEVYV